MITDVEALDIILKETGPLATESVDLASALGRVLAEDVAAARPCNAPRDIRPPGRRRAVCAGRGRHGGAHNDRRSGARRR